jgi:TonB family protein
VKPVHKIVIACLLLMGHIRAYAQSDTSFFDAQWQGTDRAHASFYRPPAMLKDDLYYATCYFMTGKVQMTGSYSNKSCSIREGYFTYYDSLGHKTSEGALHKGNRTGEWKFYFAGSETPEKIMVYNSDMLNGHAVFYDFSSGKKSLEGDYCNNLRCGKWLQYYNASDQVRFVLPYKDGAEEGELKGFYPDGKLKRLDKYEAGKFISGKCFTPDGSKMKHTLYYEPAKFMGDIAMLLKQNLRYPEAAKEKNIHGTVGLRFVINEKGQKTDIQVVESLDPACDEEAKRLLQMMDWMPPKQDGEVQRGTLIIRLPFLLN